MSQVLVIKNGNIHNGIQEEPFVADILVVDGKIAEISTNIMARENMEEAESVQVLMGRWCLGVSGTLSFE